MIGFFVNSGDPQNGELFRRYIWGDCGIEEYIKTNIINEYSEDLNLLLIMYYVEGKFPLNPPENGKVSNYSAKEKSISVSIDVTNDKFHNLTEKERRKFIVETIKLSIYNVNEKMKKKKIKFNIEVLLNDLEDKVFSSYLSM